MDWTKGARILTLWFNGYEGAVFDPDWFQPEALMNIITGQVEPSALLPYQMHGLRGGKGGHAVFLGALVLDDPRPVQAEAEVVGVAGGVHPYVDLYLGGGEMVITKTEGSEDWESEYYTLDYKDKKETAAAADALVEEIPRASRRCSRWSSPCPW